MKIKSKNILSVKKSSMTLYVVALFAVFMAFSSFVVDGTLTFNNRMKLQNITESAALAAAEYFNSSEDKNEAEANVYNTANEVFKLLSKDGLKGCKINIDVDTTSKIVKLETSAISQPFFLTFLGVKGINLKAKAKAISENLPVTAYYPDGINWLTTKSAYRTDIIKGNNLHDTAILPPIGSSFSVSFDPITKFTNFSAIAGGDNSIPLSLGPGGYITIKLPVPIVDKPGDDLFIEEAGSKEGYIVFAGTDNDPDNPYTQNNNNKEDSAGISWINISSCGHSKEISDNVIYTGLKEDVFYGSGYFDIAKADLSVIKYIRIIDDNSESAFIKDGDTYYKTMLYGESSSATPGADIRSVSVLNHVKLIGP